MIDACLAALEGVLLGMGYRKVHTDLSDLASFAGGVPSCYVYQAEPSTLTRARRKVAFTDDPARRVRTWRHLLYEERLQLVVRLVEAGRAALDAQKNEFLRRLPARIMDAENNAIHVTATGCLFIEDRAALNNKVAMEITVEFAGGVYLDRETPLTEGIEMETIMGG